MDNKFENIDNYYKNTLGDYSEDTSKDIWKDMRWTLFWMRYRWLIGIGIIFLFIGTGGLIYYYSDNTTSSNNNIQLISDNIDYTKANKIQLVEDSKEIKNEENVDRNEIIKYPINNTITTDKSTLVESNKVVIANSIHTLNRGKKSLFDKNDPELNNEVAFSQGYNFNENNELSPIESKDIKIDLVPETDTIFGKHILVKENKTAVKQDRFSVIFYGGTAYSQSNILGDNSEYLNYRNANESNENSWSVGGEIKFHIKNWIITSGLSYSVYNQRRSYMHTYQEYSPEDSYYNYDTTWMWFFDPPEIGVPIISEIDSNWVNVYNDITIDNSGINRISYLEIPLLIGYRYNANLFSFEVNTGAYFGFLMNSSIKVPDFENNSKVIEPQVTRNTMVSFAINTSIYYHLSRNTSIFISPYYKQNLKSVFNNDYPVNQRFKTYGINFGLSYSF